MDKTNITIAILSLLDIALILLAILTDRSKKWIEEEPDPPDDEMINH